MKLEDTGITSVDLDFEIPQSGVSILQFQEGITKRTNENSGKTTLQLPMVIERVIEGPEDNAGKKMSHFVPIETGFGEKQLAGILTITGLIGAFSKKFGNDVDVTDDAFVNALKLKLPGKFITATHEVRKDNSGKDRVNVIRFEKVGGGGSPKASPTQKGSGAAPVGGEGEDW
jgi:hypothetical protein